MSREIIEKAEKLIQENTVHNKPDGREPYCVLALIDKEGYPTVSTLTPSKSEGLNWITFCTGLGSNKAKRIENCSRASVCFHTDGAYNITLVGKIEIVTDPDVKQEMWYSGMEHHFDGPDAPGYCVLRFHTERYNLWVDYKEVRGVL